MSRSARFFSSAILAGCCALVILALFAVQVQDASQSADRRVGIALDTSPRGVEVVEIDPAGPAERAGIREGDVLLEINDHSIHHIDDYDIPAAGFERDQPTRFRVARGTAVLNLQVIPGTPVLWSEMLFEGLVLLCCLALGIATLQQNEASLRSRLLTVFLFLLAFELAIPFDVVGQRHLDILSWCLYFLIFGLQASVELHLVLNIPERSPWLVRHPRFVPVLYALGLGLGLLNAGTYLLEEIAEKSWLPWSHLGLSTFTTNWFAPLLSFTVLALLAKPALRHPRFEGRLQAGLVLVGVLPRVAYSVGLLILDGMGLPTNYTFIAKLYPLTLLFYTAAIFLAMYRYQLFDIEWVVRRSLLYTGLTTALVLAFYGLLATVGTLFARIVGPEHSLWIVSACTLLLGLTFGSLRNWLKTLIDQRFYPERQEMRRRIVELASELPAQGNQQRMGRHLVERLERILAVRSATLLLTDPRSQTLLTVASNRRERRKPGSLSLLLDPEDPGIVLLRDTGRPISADRLLALSPGLARRFEVLQAELVVPLVHNGRLVGVLLLGKPEAGQYFPSKEIDLLELLGHQAATSFENVRLFESATYESLTGLLRREAILDLLQREVDRAQRYGRPLSIGFADLDHFKTVNDRFGHLAGDNLLKQVAEELRRGLRSTDGLGRYGGEEFLLVFPETSMEGAMEVAEKLRRRIEKLRVPMEDGSYFEARISIGLALLDELPEDTQGIEQLIHAADKALYRAKEKGRNRVECAIAS